MPGFIRVRNPAAVSMLLAIGVALANEPQREKGLAVHMLPDRVAQITGASGGFTVKAPDGTDSMYSDAIQLVAFFQTLPSSTQENGIWVVTTHPSAYSGIERAKLKALITMCDANKIPVFTCRGSELPSGWKRSQVPPGWDDSGF